MLFLRLFDSEFFYFFQLDLRVVFSNHSYLHTVSDVLAGGNSELYSETSLVQVEKSFL